LNVLVLSNWNSKNLIIQSPNKLGIWNDVAFYFHHNANTSYDVVLVLNFIDAKVQLHCIPENVWALMQEPFIPGIFDWMTSSHSKYSKVFTHYIPRNANTIKYIKFHPIVPWHVGKSYDELVSISCPLKEKKMSIIVSNLSVFDGHKKRLSFLELLRKSEINLDIFGKGINFIDSKWDGLAKYKYSIVIENSSTENYWTEKIADCFLSWTVPIYYGCPNIAKYFPEKSFILIDINDPDMSICKIKEIIENDVWSDRFEDLNTARELVLNKYQFFPQIVSIIDKYHVNNSYKLYTLNKYKESFKTRLYILMKRVLKFLIGKQISDE
jgi:hypothetical protein